MAKETIHSGHFMTSNPHTDELILCDDEPVERRLLRIFISQEDKPVTFFKFGPKQTKSIAIDVSLHKLNKCIKVAYNKMTTPKWKNFQGFKLRRKQQIRLNNVIWRAYYMQFRGMADVMQPALVSLQPSIPDIMASFGCFYYNFGKDRFVLTSFYSSIYLYRRMALKDGVEQLSSVLPDIYGTPAKPTNAAILARAADYIDELTKEIRDGNEKVKEKQKQIEKLSKKVSSLQASLPSQSSSSASCPSNQGTLIRQYADRYIKENSKDLRFWMVASNFLLTKVIKKILI
ncbi:unnamed protein product [Dracunculus medinensis]|uniref:BHLH domain-containing protein n=1 Tax=Dracunculus medinensis TaxID=318479 RepID=A0A0N4U7P0_DRAME|nr:unnamed protein product [Dracunculus medinensis]